MSSSSKPLPASNEEAPRLRRSRRAVLQAAPPLVLGAGATLFTGSGLGQATAGSGTLMRERAARLIRMMDESQVDAALFPFDGGNRLAWNFMLGSSRAPGVALEQMTAPQKDAAMDLLAAALSPEGMTKAERIMLQQDILRDEWGKGSPDRNRERFCVQVYGMPSADQPWSWRWEGHHLSLTFTLDGDEVVGVTPTSFSSEPNTVPSGPYAGMVVLEEEAIGRRIYGDLSPAKRDRALIRESSFGNILATAGNEDRFSGERAGIPLGDLSQAQIDAILRLVEVYAVDNLEPTLATGQRSRIREGDLMAARFGWAGADLDGSSIYYRLHGDTFLIEFATLRNQPQHHHAIRHDLERNFGAHLV